MTEQIRMCHDVIVPKKYQHAARIVAGQMREDNLHEDSPILAALAVPKPGIAFLTAKKWQPGRVLRVAFVGGSAHLHDAVRAEASEWLEHANIGFEFYADPASAEVRVSFDQPGAWSSVGTDALLVPKDKPTVNFGFIQPGVVLHEFGHVLGCVHEHQHPEAGIPWDEGKVYAYYGGPPNNWDREAVQINVFNKYSRTITQFSEYDPASIMHYPIDRNLLKDPAKAVGWNRVLSERDKGFARTVYPKGTLAVPVVVRAEIPASGFYRVIEYEGKKAIVFE